MSKNDETAKVTIRILPFGSLRLSLDLEQETEQWYAEDAGTEERITVLDGSTAFTRIVSSPRPALASDLRHG